MFTDDVSQVVPITFELIESTLGSKNRDAMLLFVMKDSYFKIKIGVDDSTYSIQAKETKRQTQGREKTSAAVEVRV